MDKRKLRAAVIGCGRIGAYTRPELKNLQIKGIHPINHAEAIKANKGLELVAICDINLENLHRASLEHNISSCYKDYKALIAKEEPEIISIATRTPGRCELIEFAVNNGVKGIYIEKPISNSMEDCVKALGLVTKHRVKIAYGTVRRYMDAFRTCKSLVDEGQIGNLVQVSVGIGTAPLLWSHPHSVDTMLYFSGAKEFEFVQACCMFEEHYVESAIVIEEDPVVETAFIKFKNGVSGLITQGAGNDVILSGSKGTILIGGDGSFLQLRKKSDIGSFFEAAIEIKCEPEMSGTQRAFYELEKAIKFDKAVSIDARDILLAQEILFSIAYSGMLSGRKIFPTKLPGGFTVLGKFNGFSA